MVGSYGAIKNELGVFFRIIKMKYDTPHQSKLFVENSTGIFSLLPKCILQWL